MTSIKTAIEKLAGTHRKDSVRIFDAVVNSVDQDKRTCEVTMIGGESSNVLIVRLMASVDDGILYIPTIGSTIIVTSSDYVLPFVSMYSGIDSIVMIGNSNGAVKVADLTTKISNLEHLINHLINTYNAHTHPYVNVSSAATTSPSTSLETGTISPYIQQSDIENTTILQS